MNVKMKELREMERADILELRGELTARVEELRGKEELTAEEIAEAKEARTSLDLIELELSERSRKPIEGVKVVGGTEERGVGFMEVLRGVASGNITSEMRSLDSEGRKEMQEAGVTASGTLVIPAFRTNELQATTDPGKNLVEKKVAGILTETQEVMALTRAGATLTTGLKGNIEYITSGGVTSEWKGEIETKDADALTFGAREFSPKRLATRVDVSLQMLKQSSLDIESHIAMLFRNSIAKKLDETILGTSDVSNAPKALFTTSNIGSNKTELSMANVIKKYVNGLRDNDALTGKLSYITSNLGLAMMAGTPMGGNIQGNMVNYLTPSLLGMPVVTSNALKTISGAEPLILADWSKFFLGLWGGMEITRDPYSRAQDGVVRFILNTYWDAGFIDDKARVIGTLSAPAPATSSVSD